MQEYKLSEQECQVEFFKYVHQKRDLGEKGYGMVIANPNEGGKDGKMMGVRRKKEGLAKGFPDISVHVPLYGFAGMHIELKRVKDWPKPKEPQVQWLSNLASYHYFTALVYGHRALVNLVDAYLSWESKVWEAALAERTSREVLLSKNKRYFG